jgi:hypothetical protein
VSKLSQSVIKVTGEGTDGTTIPNGTANWAAWGAWTEVHAAVAADAVILGLVMEVDMSLLQCEIGIGTQGTEMARCRFDVQNSSSAGPFTFCLPVPVGTIPSGQNIEVRSRSNNAIADLVVKVQYAESFDSDYMLPYSSLYQSAPTGADSVSVTPNATPWAWSDWEELTSGLAFSIGIAGLAADVDTHITDYEFELGTGAPGVEVAFTKMRGGNRNGVGGKYPGFDLLPGLFLQPANTRISYRMRKSDGSDTDDWLASLLFYGPIPSAQTHAIRTFWGLPPAVGGNASTFVS